MKGMSRSTSICEAPTECQADETHAAFAPRKHEVPGGGRDEKTAIDTDKEYFNKVEVVRGQPPSSSKTEQEERVRISVGSGQAKEGRGCSQHRAQLEQRQMPNYLRLGRELCPLPFVINKMPMRSPSVPR